MAQGTIENPVINSPFVEPTRHFVMTPGGDITGDLAPRRRPSEVFVPVAKPKKLSAQLSMDAFGGPNVARWRIQGYPHTTSVTRGLLAHWQDEDRERRLVKKLADMP